MIITEYLAGHRSALVSSFLHSKVLTEIANLPYFFLSGRKKKGIVLVKQKNLLFVVFLKDLSFDFPDKRTFFALFVKVPVFI